ncbi:MAG: cytidylate kinase-like family protein [Desulfobacteraceae bacterium]|nr:MAG: cytidylate kinase-like family protein [Desulfobacteraceae bacterium]
MEIPIKPPDGGNPGEDPDQEQRQAKMERLASEYISRSCQKLFWEEVREAMIDMPPTVCFSRKIGVGSLDLARIMAPKIGYRVIDREIIEFIAEKTRVDPKYVEIFDESHPGYIKAFWNRFSGERSFHLSGYSRNLFAAFFFLATSEPTIFVGRGAHLVLPREKVFAVRCISSKPYRVERLSRTLSVSAKEAEGVLEQADSEQRRFYSSVYQRSYASADEFDVVINFDYLTAPDQIADILVRMFVLRFGIRPGSDNVLAAQDGF